MLQAISRIHTLIKLGQAQLEAFSKTTKEPSNASPNQRVPSALIVFDAVSPVRMCEYYFHQVPRGLWDTKTYLKKPWTTWRPWNTKLFGTKSKKKARRFCEL